MITSMEADREIIRLFRGSLDRRLSRIQRQLDRFNGNDVAYRVEQLARRLQRVVRAVARAKKY